MGAEVTAQRPTGKISRRQLFKYGAVTGAAATVGPMLPAMTSAAHAHGLPLPRVLPAPKPIPGGIQIPGGPLIHVFVPGPQGVTLPVSGLQLQGLDVEPSVITDYRGFTALAYLAGTATGSDGRQYLLEADMRAMKGTYIASDGTRQRGLFAFIWIDLFEPGTGSQVHDFNGGIQPSGLFWAVELPDDAFTVSHDGRRATLEAKDVCVLDSFQFLGPVNVPAKVSFTIRWQAIGRRHLRGKGTTVPPTDPAAFLGRFARARSTGSFAGSELGFSFVGRGDTKGTFAELGPERNGVFLS